MCYLVEKADRHRFGRIELDNDCTAFSDFLSSSEGNAWGGVASDCAFRVHVRHQIDATAELDDDFGFVGMCANVLIDARANPPITRSPRSAVFG